LKTGELVRVPWVRIPPPPLVDSGSYDESDPEGTDGGPGSVCTSVCTPLDEATLEAAIARLTIALATAADDDIPELVAERRALREELHALRQGNADVFDEQAICADVVDLNAKRRP
jgi:hypothetical protein